MKIAVVGAGVSGLVAARRLTQQGHEVHVFEVEDRLGGHARSVPLDSPGNGPGGGPKVEVGFLVFSEAACPCLTSLLAEIQAPTRPLRVAYEIRHADSKIVLRGGSLRDSLTVPSNLTAPSFYRLIPDWLRFARMAQRFLQPGSERPSLTLGEFLKDGRYCDAFAEQFVYPLAGAAYPCPREQLSGVPLASLIGFIHNHELLQPSQFPGRRTLERGTRDYLDHLTDSFRERIRLSCPVSAIARNQDYVLLKFPHRPRERFDQAVVALHSNTALRVLSDPTGDERRVLESFRYAPQNVYLHREEACDESAHASALWKFRTAASGQGGAAFSYRVSPVQETAAPTDLMLTVSDPQQPPPDQVLQTFRFQRPVFTAKSLFAQRQFALINGRRRTYFCGAYWGNGFHEDAVRSAQEVARLLALQADMATADG